MYHRIKRILIKLEEDFKKTKPIIILKRKPIISEKSNKKKILIVLFGFQ